MISGCGYELIDEEIKSHNNSFGLSINTMLCGPGKDVMSHFISNIKEDCPTVNSKLRKGDIILEINSEIMYGRDVNELTTFLASPKKEIMILCARYTISLFFMNIMSLGTKVFPILKLHVSPHLFQVLAPLLRRLLIIGRKFRLLKTLLLKMLLLKTLLLKMLLLKLKMKVSLKQIYIQAAQKTERKERRMIRL